MAAIVKANANLTSGGLSVLRRNFTTSDDGMMRYEVEYVCLSQYASKWTPFFKTKAQPPTPLPESMLQLRLTKTPELFDLATSTENGLTYFRAVYSAGVSTEIIITEESDVRSFTYSITYPSGYEISVPGVINGSTSFVTTGQETVTYSFDYVSTTVSATAKNENLPTVRGTVGPPFNATNPFQTESFLITDTIERRSKTRSSRGEYSYSVSSTGVYARYLQPKSFLPRINL